MASKFGSNTQHGRLFEFLRNDIFDARIPFFPPGSRSVSTSSAEISAAGWFRDRRFFFFTYEGLRQITASRFPASFPARFSLPR